MYSDEGSWAGKPAGAPPSRSDHAKIDAVFMAALVATTKSVVAKNSAAPVARVPSGVAFVHRRTPVGVP
jgi:hypothetical protein